MLESRAKELGASSFTVIPEHPQFKDIKLGEELQSVSEFPGARGADLCSI